MPRHERHLGWSTMIGSLETWDLDVNLPSQHLGLVFACPMCILPAIQRPPMASMGNLQAWRKKTAVWSQCNRLGALFVSAWISRLDLGCLWCPVWIKIFAHGLARLEGSSECLRQDLSATAKNWQRLRESTVDTCRRAKDSVDVEIIDRELSGMQTGHADDKQMRYKLSYIYQRPSPYGAEGVGAGEDQGGQGTKNSYRKVKAMSLVDSSFELSLGLRLVVLEAGNPDSGLCIQILEVF